MNISVGNRKMGAIPSFSVPTGITCSREAIATCFHDCYARQMEERLPSVRKAWEKNYLDLCNDLGECMAWLNWWFDCPNAPRLFRIHVGGDFFSSQYWKMWLEIACSHPGTQFMCFTKQFDIVKGDVIAGAIPKNLILIASAWPNVSLPEWVSGRLPIAYMQDGTENRVPATAHFCNGNCAGECNAHCWNMQAGDSVVFEKHGRGISKKKKGDKKNV